MNVIEIIKPKALFYLRAPAIAVPYKHKITVFNGYNDGKITQKVEPHIATVFNGYSDTTISTSDIS
jgi:hypothetical protein